MFKKTFQQNLNQSEQSAMTEWSGEKLADNETNTKITLLVAKSWACMSVPCFEHYHTGIMILKARTSSDETTDKPMYLFKDRKMDQNTPPSTI